MRTTSVKSELLALYCGEGDTGGVLVAHENCPTQLDTSKPEQPAICNHCKKELLYGQWCEW